MAELIRKTIRAHGPQSFAWFMQQALYHPDDGYYSSGRCVIGRKGDYFTNVSVGPLFGQLLAAQFVEVWDRLGKIDKFTIVEQGAHNGQFACDVLESVESRLPEFFEALRYRIVEPFPILRKRQQWLLEPFGAKVEWCESLEPFTGVHFSNELLDSMPVRLVKNGHEKFVGLDGDKFVFVERLAGKTALNQAALDWIDGIAANLQRGYVIAIDYGWVGDEFPRDVQVRAHHRTLNSPFEQIGEADITMPVDWSDIMNRAERNGLCVAGFADQHHFLTGIISQWPDLLAPRQSDSTSPAAQVSANAAEGKPKRALQTLLHPEMLGRAFQVLALSKNMDIEGLRLAGFKFARKPHSAES
ncbi:MAG TPA: SAM-dependent methyltransferase [Candidatus Udaeobacter sp.]|nr:SAM-dependent methyltransferase [Candidatus Udaeobacter sp.]